jgi:hypothetical protein
MPKLLILDSDTEIHCNLIDKIKAFIFTKEKNSYLDKKKTKTWSGVKICVGVCTEMSPKPKGLIETISLEQFQVPFLFSQIPILSKQTRFVYMVSNVGTQMKYKSTRPQLH